MRRLKLYKLYTTQITYLNFRLLTLLSFLALFSLGCKLLKIIANYFLFDLVPLFFGFQKVRVKHELIQRFFGLQLHVQLCFVSDPVSFFNQI